VKLHQLLGLPRSHRRPPSLLADTAFQSVGAVRPARRASAVARASSDLQKPAAPSPPSPAPPAAAAAAGPSSSGVTMEYQRQQAKALQQYFRDLKLEATVADSQ